MTTFRTEAADTGEIADLSPTRRLRGTSKNPDEARRKIIDAAIRLFGRHGFRATSTEHIAEQAGYGQATIFFHFKTKAGLLEACLDEALTRAKSSLPSGKRGTQHLVGGLDDVFDDHPTARFFARMILEQGGNSVVQPIYASFHAHIRDMVRDEIVHETGVDLEMASEAAAAILSMLIGIHTAYRVENKRLRRSDYRKMLMRVTSLILHDLSAKP